MSIPSVTITDQGLVVPSLEDTLAGLWEMFQTAFGQDLNTSLNTPQGQLITSLAAMITDERNQWVQFTNQIDPRYAQGIWQDAIGYIYFMSRNQATKSTAQLNANGLAGTVIPSGMRFSDVNGIFWQTTSSTVIGASGFATILVECELAGKIEAAANTITSITVALSGLDSVTNPVAAIAGVDKESRINFEDRRKQSVAANAKLTDASVRGSIAALKDVIDVYTISNNTSEEITHGSTDYKIPKNSILLAVVGGNDQQIAKELLIKAGSGCGFSGNTTITVQDTDTYPQNPPSYSVSFLRPTYTTLYWKIVVQNKFLVSFQEEKAMKDAIIDALKSGNTRARIAQIIRSPLYIPALYNAYGELELLSLEISIDHVNWKSVIELGVDQYPVTTSASIEVF